jgi:hypothetical protein
MARRYRNHVIGVYLITHMPSGSVYVGKSLDVFMRWNSHYAQLVNFSHHNKPLAELFKTGTDLDFQIIKLSTKQSLKADETALIQEYAKSHGDKLLNVAGNPLKKSCKKK